MALPTIHLDGPDVDTPATAFAKLAAALPEISQRLGLLERTGFQQGMYDPDPANPAYSFSAKGSPWSGVTKRAMYTGTTSFDQVHPVGNGRFITASSTATGAKIMLFATDTEGVITKLAETSSNATNVIGVVATSDNTFKYIVATGSGAISVFDLIYNAETASLSSSSSGGSIANMGLQSSNRRLRLAAGRIAVPCFPSSSSYLVYGGIGFATAGQAIGAPLTRFGSMTGCDNAAHGFTHDYLRPGRAIAAWRDSSNALQVGVFEHTSTNARLLDTVIIDPSAVATSIYVYTLGPTLALISYAVGSARRTQVVNVSGSSGQITALGAMSISGAGAITPRCGKPQDETRLFVAQQNGDGALSSIISVDTATGALTKSDIPNSIFGSSGTGTIIDVSKLGADRLIVSGRDGTTGTSYGLQVWDMT